jgi:hypothetical protein
VVTAMIIHYTYECWKCPERHAQAHESNAATPLEALNEVLTEWIDGEPEPWDYDLELITKDEYDAMVTSGLTQKGIV